MTLREILNLLNTDGYNCAKIAKEHKEAVGVGEKKLSEILKGLGFEFSNSGSKGWSFNGDESLLDTGFKEHVPGIKRTRKNASVPKGALIHPKDPLESIKLEKEEPKGTVKNVNEPLRTNVFSNDEIAILKQMVKERQTNSEEPKRTKKNLEEQKQTLLELVNEYVVPGDKKRSSFNLSSSTINSLEELAKINRINKQELVELAILLLIEQYKK